MIPITKPFFTEDEISEVSEVIKSGWVVQGPKVEEFERLFKDYVGVKYAVATSSCTTALHLILVAFGIGRGDDVIVPSFTFVATPNSVEYTGANVKFVDVDLDTFNISIGSVEKVIENDYYFDGEKLINKTSGNILKAIMPVHLLGLPADILSINEISKYYNLKVVEDGACALGAFVNGKHVGNFGNPCAFSFHPRKNITTAEGGMIVTDNEELASLLKIMRSHGASDSDYRRHLKNEFLMPRYDVLGFNYRMTDLQGALGIHQMKKLDFILSKKREIAKIYKEELKNLEGLQFQKIPKGFTHGYQAVAIRLEVEVFGKDSLEEARFDLMKILKEAGISTRPGGHATHTLGYYTRKYGHSDMDLENSWILDKSTVVLPAYYEMREEEMDYVVKNLKKAWKFILDKYAK